MTNTSNIDGFSGSSSLLEAEALAWIAQLNGENISEKDLAAFREWVNRSPAHQREIQELSQLWGELNMLTIMDEPIRQADKVSKQLRKAQSRKQWRHKLAVPALAGGMAMTALLALPILIPAQNGASIYETNVNVPVVFKTAKGEHEVHSLEDGSVITLNTDSHIEVNFTNDQRDVRLLKGEALFSVAHDEDRPFLVFADDRIVRAVGTEFSVHLVNGAIDVLVSEGSVELSTIETTKPTSSKTKTAAGQGKVASLGIIKAGHTARVEAKKTSIGNLSNEAINAELSWRTGRLEFTGEGLEAAIAEYTRYTDLKIIIKDPELEDIRLGGSFPTGEIDLFLKTLELNFGISVDRSQQTHVYLSKPR